MRVAPMLVPYLSHRFYVEWIIGSRPMMTRKLNYGALVNLQGLDGTENLRCAGYAELRTFREWVCF